MQIRTLGLIGAALLALAVAPAAFAQQYTVTDLGTLGGGGAGANGINNSGAITGYSSTTAFDMIGNPIVHAFSYTNGMMTDLGTLGGTEVIGNGINSTGTIVGWSRTTGDARADAISYANGVMTDLGALGGNYSEALAINDSGTIVGDAYLAGGFPFHACSWINGVIKDLGTLGGNLSTANAINSSGTIVGYSDLPTNGSHACSWVNGVIKDLGTLGGSYSKANGINDSGMIVGWSANAGNNQHACLFANGTKKDLGLLPGGTYSYAYAVNNSGSIVGYASTTAGSGANHGFLYANGKMTDLNTLLPANSGWELGPAYAINNSGWIVGYGSHDGAGRAFLLKPAAPLTSKISGTLTLDGLAASAAPQNVTFTLRPSDASGNLTQTVAVSASGAFSLSNAPRKNYTLHIKGDKYLAVNVSVNATGGDVAGVTATLPSGDANNDNFCDATDFNVFVSAYNSDASLPGSGYDPTGDFNGDGFVDATDFGLFVGSYGQTGDL